MAAPAGFILIVEDNQNNIKVLYDLLRAEGFRVLVAKTGEAAIAQLQEFRPDLILLDVMMPGLNGFETCRQIKADDSTRDIPVIFMTALTEAGDRVTGLELGAVDYITKPFQHEEVLARIRLHLKIHRLTQELRTLNSELEQRVSDRTAELSAALQQLQNTQIQLVQSEKMSALGSLIAGVAHEINNPVNFLQGNLKYAQNYIQDLFALIQVYQSEYPNPTAIVRDATQAIDLPYLQEDLPKLLGSMAEGAKRLSAISNGLRVFSRADAEKKVTFDVHEGLDSTLLILKHRLKETDYRPEIHVIKTYGDLPPLEGFPGQLNQVFMNLLANAIDAIEDLNSKQAALGIVNDHYNLIHVETALSADKTDALVCIRDNGIGLPDTIKEQIFDYLFTTKPVGKGTGLGLAIARQIVVEKHGGNLTVHSQPGKGAEFIISLPLHQGDAL
ncbi:MAG TPA: response regulator [Chroococcidiopsis sp.]